MLRSSCRYLALIVALIFPAIMYGCGGAGPEPDPDLKHELQRHGLVAFLETDKVAYEKGEAVRFWMAIRNEGTKPHTLTLKPMYDKPGLRTYWCIIFWGSSSENPGSWGKESPDPISKHIAPGETIHLVECEWNQSSQTSTPVIPGYYDICIQVENLYVDGHKLVNVPSFRFHDMRTIQIME